MSLFDWLRRPRRRPVADELWEWAVREHRIFRGLNPDELSRLRALAEEFLALKRFDPVRGAALTEQLVVSIAAQACLPILNRGIDWYRGWTTIIVTPREFEYEQTEYDEAGVAHEVEDIASGEILPFGPIVLSVEDVDASGWGDGYNVVIHEIAHALDRRDGELNGAPPLPAEMDSRRWYEVFLAAFRDLESRARGRARRRPLPIDDYALESPEEFFAVVCEAFFERPARLFSAYPDLYGELARFFAQDPRSRVLPGTPTQ
ncbi:MAG: zinc-dependent peptidase [Spirochaetota bacterium]